MKRKFFTFLHKSSFAVLWSTLSISLVACHPDEIEEISVPCSEEGHIHAVDLGLSVKWACCNIGANSPEEYGGYYAWGESEKKDSCVWHTYKWHNNDTGDMTMYNDTDGKKELSPEDDTAQTLWGKDWRMPTQTEIQELMDRCKWEWVSVNGVSGYRVSGNGNSIFLPAAGSQYEDLFTSQKTQGCYMSATLNDKDCGLNVCMAFSQKKRYTINSERCDGHTIRPVRK